MNKTTIGRLFFTSLAFASAVAVTQDARGDEPKASAPSNPTFADLTVGRLTAPPAKNVGWVSARESVPGLYVVSPAFNGGPVAQRPVMIVADERMAAQLKSNQPFGGREEAPAACVTEAHLGLGFDSDPTKPKEWPETMTSETHAYPKSAENPMSGVIAVHSERIVENGSSVSLESVDAWVDPATRGAKLISKSSLPLKLVRGPGFGIKVYAGRDERPDGRRFVQFVVAHAKSSNASQHEVARTNQMWTMRQDGNINHASGCGHMRVGLPIDGKDGKNGEMATVVATVILPSLGDGEPPTTTPSTTPPAPTPPPPPPVVNAKGKNAGKKPAPPPSLSTLLSMVNADGTAKEVKEREIRSRMVNIQVSVSQISREKDPLVSVSSTWGGREQVDRVADVSGGAELSPF